MNQAGIEIAPEAAGSSAAQSCLRQYFDELQHRFEQGFDPQLSLVPGTDEFAPPRGLFLIVRRRGHAIGCGGLKPLSSDTAYFKRMWIAPEARGLGLGTQLLRRLEGEALALGYAAACLETHKALVEAFQLYLKEGYREVPPFNAEPYADFWLAKRLV